MNMKVPEDNHKIYGVYEDIKEETSSQKKIRNYLYGLSDDKLFQKKIAKIRVKSKIPLEGFRNIELRLSETQKGLRFIVHPKEISKTFLDKEIKILIKKLDLDLLWYDVIEHYIIYNSLAMYSYGSSFYIEDVKTELNGPFMCKDEEKVRTDLGWIKTMSQTHPVAVFINPYMGKNDIIDYIKKTYKTEIEPIQKIYRKDNIKIGKYRTRNKSIKKRDDFILKNQTLPRKEIAKLVKKELELDIDEIYIRNIISKKK